MQVSGFLPIFLLGILGGILGESLKWYRIRECKTLPHYIKSPFYWFVTLVIIISGGFLATLYGTGPTNAMLVVNIGLSTPLIIQSMAQGKLATSMSAGRNNSLNSRPKIEHYLRPNVSLIAFLAGDID